MKVVSWKSLFASVFGIGMVLYRIKIFDGFFDILWIGLFGYLTVKCLMVSFSKQEYDEDMRRAESMRVLYRELFGGVAYIAGDIPVLLILFTGVLAYVCPFTSLLRKALVVLLITALVYTIPFSIYVNKYKTRQKQGEERFLRQLNDSEEKAWRRYDLVHNVFFAAILLFAAVYFFIGDPKIFINNSRLEESLTSVEEEEVILEDVVPFEWTSVYTFDPYTSQDRIRNVVGSDSAALQESLSEGMTNVVFCSRGRVVSSVCGYPSNLGYSLSFFNKDGKHYYYPDGGYSVLQHGDRVVFSVTRNEEYISFFASDQTP